MTNCNSEIIWAHTVYAANFPESWSSQSFDYGVRDNKGRVIGGRVSIRKRFACKRDADGKIVFGEDRHAVEDLDRPFFEVCHHALRDGRGFGAIPRGTNCATLEAAKVLAAKKVKEACARFTRLVAKGEGRQFTARS